MKQFELQKKDFIQLKDLSIRHITGGDFLSLESNIHSMEKLINYFNQQYNWDGMFTIDDVWHRNSKGDELFILFYGNESIGYIWYNKIDNISCKAYNLYVTKIVDRPDSAALWFYNKTTEDMLKKYDRIICEAEEWNETVHTIFNKTGFKEIL